jgi:hypothetical protein
LIGHGLSHYSSNQHHDYRFGHSVGCYSASASAPA